MNADEIVRELREMATYDCNYEEESDAAIEAIRLIKSLQAENKALREASQKVLEGLQKLDSALDNTTCDGDALKDRAEEAERREKAAVDLINKVAQAVEVAFNATDYVKPNTGIWHTLGLALDWIKAWRGPQEAGEGVTGNG